MVKQTNGGLEAALDPFDPAALRLDQSFLENPGVKKLLTTVPVRKPGRQDFVRVHPDEAFRLTPAAIIELKDEREVYLVPPQMVPELPGEAEYATLFTTINRQGVLSLWPVKLPKSDGRRDAWRTSAAEAASLAMKRWIRIGANMSLGAYEVFEAAGNLPDPKWPDLDLRQILEIAFKGMVVDDPDHPVIQRLRGLI